MQLMHGCSGLRPSTPLVLAKSSSSSSCSRALGRPIVRLHVAAPEQTALTEEAASVEQQQQQQQRRPARISVPPGAPITSLQQLPPDLHNATALLEAPNPSAPGGTTRVFVFGASHVSAVSCSQVQQLIHAVKPEVVLVELCKERVGLLVDPEDEDRRLETWHCRRVSLEGVPADDPLWPSPDTLLQLLATRLGAAVHTKDIEADCSRLLATGLFGRARPSAVPAKRGEAPQFGAVIPERDEDEEQEAPGVEGGEYRGDVGLQVVPPLGSIKFIVEPRVLPLISSMEVRLDSSLKAVAGTPSTEALQEVANALLDAAAAARKAKADADTSSSSSNDDAADKDKEKDKDKPTEDDNSLLTYLKLRLQLAQQFPEPDTIVVDFSGVESGRVEALVRSRRAADPVFVSGLEGSAADGEGVGIDSFRPQRSSVQLSPGMLLPAEAAERLAAVRAARQAERVLGAPDGWSPRTSYRLWQQSEVLEDVSSVLPANPLADGFAGLMTGLYARLQSGAGDQVGITPGAAWRTAMQAACEVGAQQVLLGDRPSDVSQRRLATAIAAASGGRLAAAVALLAAGVAAAATHALPELEASAAALLGSSGAADGALVGAAAAAALALVWPVVGPFVEVWRFSRLSGSEVEEAVAVKEALQANLDKPFYVWGEDALLSWPGAEAPLISERDTFMARVLAAAATSTTSNAPAFVAEEDAEGQLTWRYLMPQGATASSAPAGGGDGAYAPLAGPSAVVAVVGSAHVRGMCKAWSSSLAAPGQVQDLLEV